MGALTLNQQSGASARSYLVEPTSCGKFWLLTLFEGGEAMGGGRYERGDDATGFDDGYQSAIDQGEEWL